MILSILDSTIFTWSTLSINLHSDIMTNQCLRIIMLLLHLKLCSNLRTTFWKSLVRTCLKIFENEWFRWYCQQTCQNISVSSESLKQGLPQLLLTRLGKIDKTALIWPFILLIFLIQPKHGTSHSIGLIYCLKNSLLKETVKGLKDYPFQTWWIEHRSI